MTSQLLGNRLLLPHKGRLMKALELENELGWKARKASCIAATSPAVLTQTGLGPLPRQQMGPGDHTWNKQGTITVSPRAARHLGPQEPEPPRLGDKGNPCMNHNTRDISKWPLAKTNTDNVTMAEHKATEHGGSQLYRKKNINSDNCHINFILFTPFSSS